MNGLEFISYVCKSVMFLVTGMILIIAYAEWNSRR